MNLCSERRWPQPTECAATPLHPRSRLHVSAPDEPPERAHRPPHARVRTDKIHDGKITLRHSGTLYSIGIGRRYYRTTIKALVNGLDIVIIHATTGEVLRQLTLDPTRKYQPQTQEAPNP